MQKNKQLDGVTVKNQKREQRRKIINFLETFEYYIKYKLKSMFFPKIGTWKEQNIFHK